MSFVNSPAQFRAPLAIQLLFAIVTILLVLVLPESPRWLLKHGREDEALEVLNQLSLATGDVRVDSVNLEYAQIRLALEEEMAATVRDKNGDPISAVRACFTIGRERYFYRVMLGVGSQFMQQLCGINLYVFSRFPFFSVRN